MSSLISGSSGVTSGLDPYDPIIEEDEDVEVEILSAKRDEDAKGSMENSSMRIGGHSTEKRNKGGMLKRLSQAFKLEKEEGRRGSL